MITPVVRELKRFSPHGTRWVVPMAPARRPVTATRRQTTGAARDGQEETAMTRPDGWREVAPVIEAAPA